MQTFPTYKFTFFCYSAVISVVIIDAFTKKKFFVFCIQRKMVLSLNEQILTRKLEYQVQNLARLIFIKSIAGNERTGGIKGMQTLSRSCRRKKTRFPLCALLHGLPQVGERSRSRGGANKPRRRRSSQYTR